MGVSVSVCLSVCLDDDRIGFDVGGTDNNDHSLCLYCHQTAGIKGAKLFPSGVRWRMKKG